MPVLFSIVMLFLLCTTSQATSKPLVEQKEMAFVFLLNNLEILAEQNQPREPYIVRIISLKDHGECDGNPQSCPQVSVYIAVSSRDEEPDQKVYELPKAYGWEFIRWTAMPNKEGEDQFVVFEMKKKIISKKLKSGWWDYQIYKLHVNSVKGYVELGESDAD